MNLLLGSGGCALLLVALRALDPVHAPGRVAETLAVLLAFACTRVTLGRGSPKGLVVACALARGGARWLVGGAAAHCVVAMMGGGLHAIFLMLVDILTLRRRPERRLYNFAVVMGLAVPGWYLAAVWVPHTESARPLFLSGLFGETLAGLLLGLGAFLAAPAEPARVPQLLRAVRPVSPEESAAVQAELELGLGASGTAPGAGVLLGSGAPAAGSGTMAAPGADPGEPAGEGASEAAPADHDDDDSTHPRGEPEGGNQS